VGYFCRAHPQIIVMSRLTAWHAQRSSENERIMDSGERHCISAVVRDPTHR
jgi:hypothetical protein